MEGVKAYNVDALKAVVAANQARRQRLVLEAEDHAALFGDGEDLLVGLDDPTVGVLLVESLDRFLDAALGHQVVEILRGTPGAGVDPHGRDAEGVGLLDAVGGVLDLCVALFGVGIEEALVGRVAHEIDAQQKGVALVFLERRVVRDLVGRRDLALENFEAIEAHPRGVVEAGRDVAQGLALEAPERVGRDPDAVRPGGSRGLLLGGKGKRQGGEGSGGEKVAALHDGAKDHDGG